MAEHRSSRRRTEPVAAERRCRRVAVEALRVVENRRSSSRLIAEPVAGDELDLELALAEDLLTDDSFAAEPVEDLPALTDAVAEAPEAAASAEATEEDEVLMSLASFELPVSISGRGCAGAGRHGARRRDGGCGR